MKSADRTRGAGAENCMTITSLALLLPGAHFSSQRARADAPRVVALAVGRARQRTSCRLRSVLTSETTGQHKSRRSEQHEG